MPTLTAQVNDEERWHQTEEAIEAAERGEVVPAEEVFSWLDTWGREGSVPK